MPTISQKAKKVNIIKVQTESFSGGVSRTFAAHKMEFFVTLVTFLKLAAKHGFLEQIF